jgi:hypothetical protein
MFSVLLKETGEGDFLAVSVYYLLMGWNEKYDKQRRFRRA